MCGVVLMSYEVLIIRVHGSRKWVILGFMRIIDNNYAIF
jgi:hypothetical protein